MRIVVVSDMSVTLPRSVTDRMSVTRMKVLGPEWVIQSLIHGEMMEFEPFLLQSSDHRGR